MKRSDICSKTAWLYKKVQPCSKWPQCEKSCEIKEEMAVMVYVDSKNFNNNNSDKFCADSWDKATQIDQNCCY